MSCARLWAWRFVGSLFSNNARSGIGQLVGKIGAMFCDRRTIEFPCVLEITHLVVS